MTFLWARRCNDGGARRDLAAVPTPASHSPPVRTRPAAREIDRDERVVLMALRRRLSRVLREAREDGGARELTTVLATLTAAVEEARVQARRLNDARITRRGERAQQPRGPAPPAALAGHACHGEYLGAFAGLAAVGAMMRASDAAPVTADALIDLALALHLHGVLWTLDDGGRVHVFRCRG